MKKQHPKSWLLLALLLTGCHSDGAPVTAAHAIGTPPLSIELPSEDRVPKFSELLAESRGPVLSSLLRQVLGEKAKTAEEQIASGSEDLARAVNDTVLRTLKERLKGQTLRQVQLLASTPLSNAPAAQAEAGELEVVQTDRDVTVKGQAEKTFETGKGTIKRTQKAESRAIDKGDTVGIDYKFTETIEAGSNTESKTMRRVSVIAWHVEVAVCPDAAGITLGTVKQLGLQNTVFTENGVSSVMAHEIRLEGAAKGSVNDDAYLSHYDLKLEVTAHLVGHEAAHRKGLIEGPVKDGKNRVYYILTGNQIEVRPDGGERIPPKAGELTLQKDSNVSDEDAKKLLQAAAKMMWNSWGFTNDYYAQAQRYWRNSGCVDVRIVLDKNKLRSEEQIAVHVTSLHKKDQSGIHAKLEAGSLDGVMQPDVQQGSPSAEFTFVAGAPNPEAYITVTSTSKRGIGIGDVTFAIEKKEELEDVGCLPGAGWRGQVLVRQTTSEFERKVIGKGEDWVDYDRSGVIETRSTFDYDSRIQIRGSGAPQRNEDGSYYVDLMGGASGEIKRALEERKIFTTVSKCFDKPPGILSTDSTLNITETAALNSAIEGYVTVNGNAYEMTFSIPEVAGVYRRTSLVLTSGSCNPEGDLPVNEADEMEMSFDQLALKVKGSIDPKKKNVIEGATRFKHDNGTDTSVNWRIRMCK